MDRPRTRRTLLGATTVALGLALMAGLWAARQAGAGGEPPARHGGGDAHRLQTVARVGETGEVRPLSELLSGIDYAPSRGALDNVMGPAASEELVAIARGRDGELDDPGLRIRAYAALAHYESVEVVANLRDAIVEHGAVEDGVDTLYLRAAMDALARVVPDIAATDLAAMLTHPNRDVRAGAARALGLTGSDTAIPHLRARLPDEPVLQVRLAIADALRRLDQASEGTGKAAGP